VPIEWLRGDLFARLRTRSYLCLERYSLRVGNNSFNIEVLMSNCTLATRFRSFVQGGLLPVTPSFTSWDYLKQVPRTVAMGCLRRGFSNPAGYCSFAYSGFTYPCERRAAESIGLAELFVAVQQRPVHRLHLLIGHKQD
jgi:hypothetical protein